MEYEYPFSTLGQAIAFYKFRNPARQRFTNIYEPDRGGFSEHFSGTAGELIYAAVANAIARTLRTKNHEEYWSFIYWHIVIRDTDKGLKDIAKELRISERQVRRYIEQSEEQIAKQLVNKKILDPYYEDNSRINRELRKQEENPN